MASQQTSMSTAQAVHNHIEVIEKIDGDTEVANDIEPPEPSGCFCCFCKGGKVRCKSSDTVSNSVLYGEIPSIRAPFMRLQYTTVYRNLLFELIVFWYKDSPKRSLNCQSLGAKFKCKKGLQNFGRKHSAKIYKSFRTKNRTMIYGLILLISEHQKEQCLHLVHERGIISLKLSIRIHIHLLGFSKTMLLGRGVWTGMQRMVFCCSGTLQSRQY